MSLFRNEAPNLGSTTTIGGSIVPTRIHLNIPLTAASVSQTVFVAPVLGTATWRVTAIGSGFGAASSSGTFKVEVAQSGTALGSGTSQQTAATALSGTAATPVNTVVSTTTIVKAGGMVNLIIAGTMTNLVAGVVSIDIERVS